MRLASSLVSVSLFVSLASLTPAHSARGARLAVSLGATGPAEVDEAWIRWDGVAVRDTGGAWTTLDGASGTVDLVGLGDALQVLGLDALSQGVYDQVRVRVVESWAMVDGARAELTVPSGDSSGLKIKTRLRVPECGTASLTLRWDLDAHLVETGRGRFVLRPVVDADASSTPSPCQRVVRADDAETVIWGAAAGVLGGFPHGIGDLDGDGYADIIAGERSGPAHVFYGPVAPGQHLGSDGQAHLGSRSGGVGRRVLLDTGDLDGDGIDDVGFRENRESGVDPFNLGWLHIVPGGSRIVGTHDVSDLAFASFKGRFDRSIYYASGDFDHNGDGFDDLCVDAHGDLSGAGDGWAYIVHGPMSGNRDVAGAAAVSLRHTFPEPGLQQTCKVADFDGDGVLDVSLTTWGPTERTLSGHLATVLGPVTGHTDLPAGADFLVTGPPGGEFGRSTLVVDLDGDAAADRLVGAPAIIQNPNGPGAVYGFTGAVLASGSADVVSQLSVASTVSGEALGYDLATGDWNGDGQPDIAIANAMDPATMSAGGIGRVLVFFEPALGSFDAEDADLIIEGPPGVDLNEVANAGDTDGDGIDDLLLGSTYATDPSRSGSLHGAVFLFLGRAGGPGATP